jgi:hypothetical protein
MHFSAYDVFYSLYSHQHVSAALAATFRVLLILQEYKGANMVSCVSHSITIKIIFITFKMTLYHVRD